MKIHHFALALFMLTGQMLYADGNQCAPLTDSTLKFESLQVCRSCVPESDINRKDSHCQNLMDTYNYCVDKQYINYLNNNTSATDDQKNMALATYQNNCTASTTAASTTTTTPTATATTAQSLADAQRAAAAQAASQDQARARAAAAAAATGGSVTAGATGNSSVANTALLAVGLQAAPSLINSLNSNNSGNNNSGSGNATPTATASTPGSPATPSAPGAAAAPAAAPGSPAVAAAATASPEQLRLGAARACATFGDPSDTCTAANRAANQSALQGSGTTAPATANTTAVQAQAPTLEQIKMDLSTRPNPLTEACSAKAKADAPRLVTEINEFIEKKGRLNTDEQSCTGAAERAQFLCAEGTSPGAQLVHGLINVGGPALALIGAARQSCSSTSSLMDLASMGLMVAKGACVGAKLFCDSTCGATIKLVQKINADLTKYQTTVKANTEACRAALNVAQAAMPVASAEVTKINADITTLGAINTSLTGANRTMSDEASNVQHQGTTAGLAKSCQDKMKDILIFAADIGGMMLAKGSADKCESQLAATGSSSDTSITQYCQNPANSQTSTCVCENSPQSPGCPGALNLSSVSASGDSSRPTDQQGLRVGNNGGVSGFASGANGSAAGTGSTALNLGGGTSGSSGVAGFGSGDKTFAGSSMPALGGGAGGGSGGTATGTADAQKSGTGKDKNPWSFGALASTVGGFLSGSYKNGSGSGSAWTEAQQQTVDRRIASDKVAAEISSANGKSNWQKIREQYLSSESTFINGK